MKLSSLTGFICLSVILSACFPLPKKDKLIIFHAGSLSLPFKEIARAFEETYPNIQVELEAAGSRACARKITDLNKPCDLMASADYNVIDNLLIPEFASDNFKFASNEMALVFSPHSKRNKELNAKNWPTILTDPEIHYGRSDPDSDPCGYRTVLLAKLAEEYYQQPGFADRLLKKDKEHIRPKEVDLLALLDAQIIDYVFIYRSIAEQHQLPYLILPDSINLKCPQLTDYYQTKSVSVSGKKPNETITHYGEPIIYSITQIKTAPHPKTAQLFLQFFFTDSVGIKIMNKNGQPGLPNLSADTKDFSPKKLNPNFE